MTRSTPRTTLRSNTAPLRPELAWGEREGAPSVSSSRKDFEVPDEDPSALINRMIKESQAFTDGELDALEAAIDRLRNPVRIGRCPPLPPTADDMLLITAAIQRSFLCNRWEAKFVRD